MGLQKVCITMATPFRTIEIAALYPIYTAVLAERLIHNS